MNAALLFSFAVLAAIGVDAGGGAPGAAGTAKTEGPCPVISDACFAELEREHAKRGEVGVGFTPPRAVGERYAIRAVTPGGPAARAGLRVGDLLVAINGQSLPTDSQEALEASATVFHETLLALGLGERVVYSIVRDGRTIDVEMVTQPRSIEMVRYHLRAYLFVHHGGDWGHAYSAYVRRQSPPSDGPAASPLVNE